MNIYVGNLAPEVSEDDLEKMFEKVGTVAKASIIIDRMTGNSRGFGFVEMPVDEDGEAAISQLNGQELKGRPLKVSEAHPKGEGARRDRPDPRKW